jgi:hypothetical protein
MAEVSTTGFWYSEPFSDGRGAECSRGETSERNFGLKQLGTGLCYIRTVDLSRAFGVEMPHLTSPSPSISTLDTG